MHHYFYTFINDFIPFSPNLTANLQLPSHAISYIHRIHLVPGGLSEIWWHAFSKPHLPPDSHNSSSPRHFFCSSDLKLLSPPPLGILCHSNASRPNSALGRGGIRNPVPRCLRPLGHRGSMPLSENFNLKSKIIRNSLARLRWCYASTGKPPPNLLLV